MTPEQHLFAATEKCTHRGRGSTVACWSCVLEAMGKMLWEDRRNCEKAVVKACPACEGTGLADPNAPHEYVEACPHCAPYRSAIDRLSGVIRHAESIECTGEPIKGENVKIECRGCSEHWPTASGGHYGPLKPGSDWGIFPCTNKG